MASLALGVRFNPVSAGVLDFVYASVVTGYRDPVAGLVNSKTYRYRAESADLSQWEFGTGIWSSSTNTLSRNTVDFSSTGAKVSFTVQPQVAITIEPADVLQFDDTMALTTAQQAMARSNIYAAPMDALAFNNIIINGAMEVDQIRFGASVAFTVSAASYVIDQWMGTKTGTMNFTCQQVADAPPGFTNSLKVAVTVAEASLGAGDFAIIYQPIEGFRAEQLAFGTASPQTVTIGFWTKIHRTGVYSGVLKNPSNTRTYPFTFTQNVADTWEYKTVQIPGDGVGSGAWLGGTLAASMLLGFCIAGGSTSVAAPGIWTSTGPIGATGTTNGVAATSDVFQITGVTMFAGTQLPVAVNSAFLMRPYAEELRLCQRYFWSSGQTGNEPAAIGATNPGYWMGGTWNFPVQMRTDPTMGYTGTFTVQQVNQPVMWLSSKVGFTMYATGTVGTASAGYFYSNSGAAIVTADARM